MKIDGYYIGVLAVVLTIAIVPMKDTMTEMHKIGLLVIESAIGAVAGFLLIPQLGQKLIAKGIFGKDINKGTPDPVPESMGLIVGLIFFCVSMLFMTVYPNATYVIGIAVIIVSYVIGLIDDFIDIRWRYKLLLSFCSALIVTTVYPGNCELFGFKLGSVYLLGLVCLMVFFINSINMYAGVNGLESGQCVVIAIYSIIHCIIRLMTTDDVKIHDATISSLYILIPFLFVTVLLFHYNKFPSKVFVGDSFTYFAGGVLGVASIVGGYDRLMFLFFFPAFINFFVSIPQLIGIIYCPRHRLPKLNKETGNLECVKSHHTMLNLILFIVGPKTEHQLVNIALLIQIVSCGIMMGIAYFVFPSLFINTF